ncbi:MAG: DUF4266 domain-containing protein [Polyangiaceae bacterium]|nr:DUF4266 domain-containing protein [Polyangiaceae bacterium]MCK6534860.1 DUF4266 domain-containing protein [Polyangiaceae bacterium]
MKKNLVRAVIALGLVGLAAPSAGCATVRPEQRSILADPVMQFESESPEERQLEHVLENREGSFGGGSVKGGGCGCN